MEKYRLYLYVDNEYSNLNEIYDSKIQEHNQVIYDNENPYKDSGFDLYNPEELIMKVNECNKMNLRVKCAMVRLLNDNNEVPCGFYLYPRSSISKTKFRLANNVGIIDSGYRGNLCGMFDVVNSVKEILCPSHLRLLQICSPTLAPFEIVKVQSDAELGTTQRGSGGFGSTGSGV
tara:strand:+ start:21 stop:545 length:525 start_codon:yes stop_codon:yes gene_type:complete